MRPDQLRQGQAIPSQAMAMKAFSARKRAKLSHCLTRCQSRVRSSGGKQSQHPLEIPFKIVRDRPHGRDREHLI